MNHLVVYAHPNPKSFNSAIKTTVETVLKEQEHEVVVRDLYEIGFNPVLSGSDFAAFKTGMNFPADIKTEQEYVTWADVITFIYPIWWTGLPAIAKGYVDRIFSYGFAYAADGNGGYLKLLAGKKGVILNTQGHPENVYEEMGMKAAMEHTSDKGIFEFCGIELIEHKFFGSVPFVDDTARAAMLNEVRDILHRHFGQK
ncbi:NAD(P)H-dependent oxidoreductase [Priestia megaterium]|nr:NAD(P)H-dependent oxidoreductase [Priestia megaterium]